MRRRHAHPPAVTTEETPVGQRRGPGDGLEPPSDLGLRQPDDFLPAANTIRPDAIQRPHGGGVTATTAPTAPRRSWSAPW